MIARRTVVIFAAAVSLQCAAAVVLKAPSEGEVVSQLWPEQKEFLETPLERRISGARTDAESAGVKSKRMKRKRTAMPVRLEWTGDAAPFSVTVAREPDGKVFFSANVTSSYVEVTGLLEMARKWKWTVSDGTSSASGSFSTEDYAPRILDWPGVSNVRDIGGRIGLNGRRVKQGLVFRSGGLNNNAKIEYYKYDEILAMHKAGTLAKAGAGYSRHLGPEYEAKLSKGKNLDRHFLRLIKAPPSAPGLPKLTDESRAYILEKFDIKTDLDFRGDWECYGMTGSPLGDDVTWCHYPCRAGYGGFVTPLGRATAAEAFSLLVNRKNYPIVFHCIGGTDRTGTFAYLLNGLLGVAEDELILDYDISFMGGQGPDARHRSWQSGLTTAVRKLPGDTLAEKLKQYFISLGFTEEEVEGVREFLLEPKSGAKGCGDECARPREKAKPARLGARIVPIDPLLDFVDAKEGKMTFFWNGEPAAAGCRLSVSVDGGPAVFATLGADRRATVKLGALVPGRHDIKVSIRAAGGGRLARNKYTITAIQPPRPIEGRRLNNFVVELLDAPLADGAFTFDNPREGWVFIGFDRPYPSACAMLDDGAAPVVEFRPDEPSETMRWLGEGQHRITVKGASDGGRLSVRLVKPLKITARTFAKEKTALSLGLKGYGWDFFRRWQIPSFNYLTMGGNWRLRSATDRMAWGNAELLKRGRLPKAAADVRPGDLELRADFAQMRGKFALSPAYRDGLALEMDENKINAPAAEMDAYAEAVWELVADRSPRAMFSDICDVPSQPLTNFTAQVSSIAAVLNTGRGHGMLVPEMYLGAKQTEEERDAQEDKALAFVESLRAAIPSAPSHTIHLMGGWLTVGSWSSYSSCEIDIKVLYDHYIRRLATDPACHDVGGVGMSTLACDEEVARWTARLVHHYCIEGRTGSLAERFGYKYRPEIVKDGDFLEGLTRWTAHPAAADSLRAERRPGYGGKKGQCRMARSTMALGECFALFTQSAAAPNRLVQRVSGLIPGKYYTLTYCTADYDDVCEPGKHPTDGRLAASLDAAEIVPELSFEWAVPDAATLKKPDVPPHCVTVTQRTVFRAKAAEGELTFSDWKDAAGPGDKPGRRLLLNYVSIKPYYIESEDELEQLKSLAFAQ